MDDINGKKDFIEAILQKNIRPKLVDIKENSGSFESSDLGQEEVPYSGENKSYLQVCRLFSNIICLNSLQKKHKGNGKSKLK